MTKIFTILSVLLIAVTQNFYAQTQIENGDFENWENVGSDTEEPNQWSSLKTSTDDSFLNLASQAPQVIWQETSNTHSGSACIRLKVAPYNLLVGLSPNAIVTNGHVFASTTPADGYVFTDESDTKWNTSCSQTPDSLIGWYKYVPQSGDKGKVEILFHTNSSDGKLPENGTTNHHVGNGIVEFTSAKPNWTRFSFPINYITATLPNYFLIVATAGDELNAQENSELWLDDLSFIYNPDIESAALEEVNIPYTLFSTNQQLKLSMISSFNTANLALYSLDGKMVWNTNFIELNNTFTPNLSSGIYVYQLIINHHIYSGKVNFN